MSMTSTRSTRSSRSSRSTRRLGLASSAAATAALLMLVSACGTEDAVRQAPAKISAPKAASTETQSSADRAECLVSQAKQRSTGAACAETTPTPETTQPLYLAPSGRPVPLPGQQD
jgi:hypothetical protein